jgi:hypothetical protein
MSAFGRDVLYFSDVRFSERGHGNCSGQAIIFVFFARVRKNSLSSVLIQFLLAICPRAWPGRRVFGDVNISLEDDCARAPRLRILGLGLPTN